MKKLFRISLNKYNPVLVLRNEERLGIINALYLDYLLDNGMVASIAVIYTNHEVLKDLNNMNIPLAIGYIAEEKDSLADYIHLYPNREYWVNYRVNPISTPKWLTMCDIYYNTVVSNIKSYNGDYEVKSVETIKEPFNIVYVKAMNKLSRDVIHIRAGNKLQIVYDLDNIDKDYKKSYMNFVEYVNKCIGGEPVWKEILQMS